MKALALACALALVCAPAAHAAGERFRLRWIDSYFCDEGDSGPYVRSGGYLTVVSDDELQICTSIVWCQAADPAVTGTTTWVSSRRGVFIGSFLAPFDGPTMVAAELTRGRDGELKSVRGTFISPAEEAGRCASRGRFRTLERIDP